MSHGKAIGLVGAGAPFERPFQVGGDQLAGQLGEREPHTLAHELLKLGPVRCKVGDDCRLKSRAATAATAMQCDVLRRRLR